MLHVDDPVGDIEHEEGGREQHSRYPVHGDGAPPVQLLLGQTGWASADGSEHPSVLLRDTTGDGGVSGVLRVGHGLFVESCRVRDTAGQWNPEGEPWLGQWSYRAYILYMFSI